MIDSGASHHVTHDKSLFLDYKPLDQTYVTLHNGYNVKIEGTRFIKLTDVISLYNVLYIPEFKFNLLSVSVLAKTLHSQVSFTTDECFIQDRTQDQMIGQGIEMENLYVMNLPNTHDILSFRGMSSACSSLYIDSVTWHKRLGHPSMSKVDFLSDVLILPKQKSNKNHEPCHVCHLSKQKHLSFTSHRNMCEKLFELIHIDTWGPFSVPTKEGYRFFLEIVDNFSRATWVYLLKHKSDVLQVSPDFITMVETQYNMKVCAVRSDNANERNFTDLYRKKGIKAFHSCPETLEQNSVGERKHQHLLNVARVLMFQSGISLDFWGDCVLTASFLINKLPSKVLKDQSPYQKLTSKVPDYHSLKTFGCLCNSSTSSSHKTKSDPRARACVFLGYPNDYKGYKLLDIETHSFLFLDTSFIMRIFFPLCPLLSLRM